jgi:hypothetical protein
MVKITQASMLACSDCAVVLKLGVSEHSALGQFPAWFLCDFSHIRLWSRHMEVFSKGFVSRESDCFICPFRHHKTELNASTTPFHCVIWPKLRHRVFEPISPILWRFSNFAHFSGSGAIRALVMRGKGNSDGDKR